MKIRFHKAMAAPTLPYKSQIWTITKKPEAKTENAEIDFLRIAAG
jgi:hypothetical protein